MKTGHAAPLGLCFILWSFTINMPLLTELAPPHVRNLQPGHLSINPRAAARRAAVRGNICSSPAPGARPRYGF
jgi:hypothetical protein